MAKVKGTKKVDAITVNDASVIVVTAKKKSKSVIAKNGNNRIYGLDGKDKITVSGGKKNLIYGDAGNDTITVTKKTGTGNKIYGGAGNDTFKINGGKSNYFYGGAGNDVFKINGGGKNYIYGGAGRDTYLLSAFTGKTNLVINQSGSKFGDMDVLQLKNVKKTDVKYKLKDNKLIITHKNGGTIAVNNWGKRPLSEIQFVGTKTKTLTNYDITDKLKSYKYRTITKSGTYKATGGNDKLIVSAKKKARTLLDSSGTDGNNNPTNPENSSGEIINGFPVTRQIIIDNLGVGGIDSLDVSSFGGWSEFYFEDKDLILPMIENAGDITSGDDDIITKITLKDFAAKDRIFELIDIENTEPNHLIVNSGNIVQGTTGRDMIYVMKNGQSVFGNGDNDDVYIYGHNNTKVTFSNKDDDDYAFVSIKSGNSNVINANGAEFLTVWLENSSGNTIIGGTGFNCWRSNNNRFYGSAGNDEINVSSNSTNNVVYAKAGNDHIFVNGDGGNKFWKWVGAFFADIFDIGWFCEGTGGIDSICDYIFGTDTLQVSDSNDISDSVVSGSDIVLNLRGGGSVKVIGAAANGISILDSSTGKTFNPLN